MTKPFDLREQESQNWFRPKHRKAVLFAQSKFDAVQMIDSQKFTFRQVYSDLNDVQSDCIKLRQCLVKFEIMDQDIYDLSDNPTMQQVGKVFDSISKELRESKKKKPADKHLLVFLFAGHGVLRDGMQFLIYNEYNKREGFYQMLSAEAKLRSWAEIYPQTYIIGIFACCRQLYDPYKMVNLYSLKEARELGLVDTKDRKKLPVHKPEFEIAVAKFEKAKVAFEAAQAKYKQREEAYEQIKKEEEQIELEPEPKID